MDNPYLEEMSDSQIYVENKCIVVHFLLGQSKTSFTSSGNITIPCSSNNHGQIRKGKISYVKEKWGVT